MEPAWLRAVLGLGMDSNVLRDCTAIKAERCGLQDADLAPLRNIPRLERLYLARNAITDKGLTHLAGLRRLQRLSLWGNRITDDGLRHLAKLRSLELLDIHDPEPVPYTGGEKQPLQLARPDSIRVSKTPGGLTSKCLSHLEGLTRLRKLNFSFPVDDDGLAVLEKCPHLRLPEVVLQNVTEARLANLPRSLAVEKLVIVDGQFGDDGLGQLARMTTLKELWLERPQVSPPAWQHLAQMCQLVELLLVGPHVTDETLKHVGTLGKLEFLSLAHSSVTDRGVAYLAGLKKLRRLDLRSTQTTNDCLDHLVGMTSLEILALDGPLDDPSLKRIARFPALWSVACSPNREPITCYVTDSGVAEFAKLRCLPIIHLCDAAEGEGIAGVDIPGPDARMTDAGVAPIWKNDALQYVMIRGRDLSLHAVRWDPGVTRCTVRLRTALPLARLIDDSLDTPVVEMDFDNPWWGMLSVGEGYGRHAIHLQLDGPGRFDLTVLRYTPHLRRLNILHTVDRSAWIGEWDNLRFVPELREFCTTGNVVEWTAIDAGGIRAIGEMKGMLKLAIGLDTALTPEELLPLGNLQELTDLQLCAERFSGEQLRFIAQLHNLKRLRIFAPPGSPADEEGLRYLSELERLQELWLNEISNASLPHIGRITSLTRLSITGDGITDEGSKHLDGLKALEYLDARATSITEKRLRELHSRRIYARTDR